MAFGQAKTGAPDRILGAPPAMVERIKIKGAGLEDHFEGNAAEHDAETRGI